MNVRATPLRAAGCRGRSRTIGPRPPRTRLAGSWPQWLPRLISLLLFTSVVTAASTARADTTICIELAIRTVDSGESAPGGAVEDYYQTCDDDDGAGPDLGCSVYARGMRIALRRSGVTTTYDLDDVGCATVPSGLNQQLWLYGYATNSRDAIMRIHNGGPSTIGDAANDWYPGSTYSIYDPDVDLSNNTTATLQYGAYDEKWTTMAALTFGMHRHPYGLSSGQRIHVAIDETTSCASSAHEPSVYTSRDQEGDHYIRIARCASSNHTRLKFLVAHELGHGILCLFAGVQGCEPNFTAATYQNSVPVDNCAAGGLYGIGTKEWNAVGFREGFGHYVSSRIWNDPEPTGQFRWFGLNYNLEYFLGGTINTSGGRLENVCCVGAGCANSWSNAGTNEDWLNFYWDWRTNASVACPEQPSSADMVVLFAYTIGQNPGDHGYYSVMRNAAAIMTWLPTCLNEYAPGSRIDVYADWNGINHD